jgi:hypothetical protein
VSTSVASVRISEQAEELIRTLPGVVSVRVVDDADGSLLEIHILTTSEISAKQTVRNVESALFAHLGIRIDHRRISVAATTEAPPPAAARPPSQSSTPSPVAPKASRGGSSSFEDEGERIGVYSPPLGAEGPKRRVYFEDVEVRGSRSRGLSCRVTLMKDGTSFIGESRGVDGDRARLELAARAACLAIGDADGKDRQFGLEGVRVFDAFERKFVFVGITVRAGRDARLLAGTCEIGDSAETAAVLAVLDATNRWIEYGA